MSSRPASVRSGGLALRVAAGDEEEAGRVGDRIRLDDGQPVPPFRPVDVAGGQPPLRDHFEDVRGVPLARPGRHDREPEGRVRRLDVAIEGGFSGWSCGGSGAGDRGRLGVDDRTRTPNPASGIRPGPEGQGGCDQARTENRGDSRAHGRTRPTRRDHTADSGAKTNLSRSIFPAADLVSTTGRADTRSGGPLPCTAPASSSMHVSRLFRLGRVLRSASVLAATLVLTAGRAAAQVPGYR